MKNSSSVIAAFRARSSPRGSAPRCTSAFSVRAFRRASASVVSAVRPELLVAGLAGRVLVAQVVGALPRAGLAHLDVEAGHLGVAELAPALVGCGREAAVDECLG